MSREATASAPSPPRRTQQQRRDETRAALLRAALECLCDAGLAGFTTTEVGSRAGLSQGALFRYFPTKASLLAATSEHLFAVLRGEYEARFRKLPAAQRSLSGGVQLLWRSMTDPRLAAAYELYTASRTDAELRRALTPVVDAHVRRIHELADTLLPPSSSVGADWFHGAVDLVILSMQGLVVNQMALPDPHQVERLLSLLEVLSKTGPLAET